MNAPDLHHLDAGLLRARLDFVELARPSVAMCLHLGFEWREIEAHCGGVYMAPIRPDGPWFDFDRDGTEAAVIEVRAADSQTVVDLCAWVPALSDRWFRAVGGAPALGMACAANRATYAVGLPLQIHRTPADWLQERCFGAVLLDLDAGVEWLTGLSLADAVAVHDDEHALRIDGVRRRLSLSRHQRLVVPAPNIREAA